MKRIKTLWSSLFGDADRRIRMGRVIGFFFMTLGVVLIALAWNGAANRNFVEGQFPYLLSGGVMGLALVIVGATLLFLATIRAERELMTDRFDEMIRLLGRNLNRLSVSSNGSGTIGPQVVASDTVFHRAECKILQGKEGLATVTVEQAEAEGLTPCRVCEPPRSEASKEASSDAGAKTEVLAATGNGGPNAGSETPAR
ncbi:MAG: hypothetical protein ACLGIB_05515 [Actinomycetota bacterium]